MLSAQADGDAEVEVEVRAVDALAADAADGVEGELDEVEGQPHPLAEDGLVAALPREGEEFRADRGREAGKGVGRPQVPGLDHRRPGPTRHGDTRELRL